MPRCRRRELAEWLDAQPLAPPAIGLAVGIWLDAVWPVPLPVAASLFVGAGVALLAAHRRPWLLHAVLGVAALSAGATLHDVHFRRLPAGHVARYCAEGSIRMRLTGTLLVPPEVRPVTTGRIAWSTELPRTRLLIEAEEIQGRSGPLRVCGIVAVHVRQPVLHVTAGDRVECVGTLYRPPSPDNPGQHDWSLILRRKGILTEMSCERAADVEVKGIADGGSRWIASLRRRLRAAMLDRTMPADVPGADLLSALVLGQRSAVGDAVNQAFVDTGTVHYLSVSGAHVGMLASAIWGIGVLVGASRRSCAVWAMILITAYTLLTEPQPPVVRSALMGNLLCVSVLLGRPLRSTNWLALSAIILLLVQPMQLFDPSFQLSYVTILAVMFLGPRVHAAAGVLIRRVRGRDDPLFSFGIQRRLNPPSPARIILDHLLRLLGWSLAISVAAWLVGSILGACHFRQVAFWGWLNTILITPLVWLVLVLGFIKAPVSLVLPAASRFIGWPLGVLTDWLLRVVEHLQHLPGSGTPTPTVPTWLAAAALGAIAAWMIQPWLRAPKWCVIGAALVTAACGLWQLSPPRHRGALILTFPSITNGSACVINFPDGHTWIYDIGSLAPYDVQRWVIGPVMAEQRVWTVDAVVLSHPNLDHFSGLPGLLDRRTVGRVLVSPWFSDFSAPGQPAHRLLVEVQRAGVPIDRVRRGTALPGPGGVTVEVLWPPPAGTVAIREANESSIVLRLSYEGRRILLCGDIMAQAQGHLLALDDLRADVLVLPHHGSTSSDPRPFILAVNPRYCIRSGGNRSADVASRLADVLADRVYLDTQNDGAVVVDVRRSGLSVRPWRAAPRPR